MTYEILRGDCIEQMRAIPDSTFDSIVTDPPYELGFMGKSWDASGIAYNVDMWRDALRVLKPGGHLLAFSGSRTYHRMTCAIEDAGFEVRDQIMWVYGSGFPKSLDVSKAIDKAADDGALGAGVTRKSVAGMAPGEGNFSGEGHEWKAEFPRTGAATDAARQWEGWGTALKPAHEPICVARKPLAKGATVAANVLQHGTGAINIDGCRVAAHDGTSTARKPSPMAGASTYAQDDYTKGMARGGLGSEIGRWPANLIHDGSAEVLALFPDQQSGSRTAGVRTCMGFHGAEGDGGPAIEGSSGSAARFFYCAKASRSDRGPNNTHPTVKPLALMQYLCRLVTPPGGRILDPFAGSGTTIVAALREGFTATGIELLDDHAEIIEGRLDHELYGDIL